MHRSLAPRRTSRSAWMLGLALPLFLLAGCGTTRTTLVSAFAPVPKELAREMGEFKYVTQEIGETLHAIPPSQIQIRTRGERLYTATAAAYNPLVEQIARSIEQGQPVEGAIAQEFKKAEARQQELIAFLEEQRSAKVVGFPGMPALMAAASSFVAGQLRELAEEQVRGVAANIFRREYLLPAFDQLAQQAS